MTAPLLPVLFAPPTQTGSPVIENAGVGAGGPVPAGLSALARLTLAGQPAEQEGLANGQAFSSLLLIEQGSDLLFQHGALAGPDGDQPVAAASLPVLPEALALLAETIDESKAGEPLTILDDVPLGDIPATPLHATAQQATQQAAQQAASATIADLGVEPLSPDGDAGQVIAAKTTQGETGGNDTPNPGLTPEIPNDTLADTDVQIAAPDVEQESNLPDAPAPETTDIDAGALKDSPVETAPPLDLTELPLGSDAGLGALSQAESTGGEQALASAAAPVQAATSPGPLEDNPGPQSAHEAKPLRPVPTATPGSSQNEAQAGEGEDIAAQKPLLPEATPERRPATSTVDGEQTTGTTKTQTAGETSSQFGQGQGQGDERGAQRGHQGHQQSNNPDPALEIDLTADRPTLDRTERASRPSFGDALLNAGRSARLESDFEHMPARLRIAAANGIERLTVSLRPASLGSVDVQIDSGTDGAIRASFVVQRQETLDLLQRDSRLLERALGDAGLQVDQQSLDFSLSDQGGGYQGTDEDSANGSGGGQAPTSTDESTVQDIPLNSRAIIEAGRVDVHI